MTKLVIDYPAKYTELSYGDVTFVLAHLYLKNQVYKDKINYIQAQGRELMLDNGAWEFGSSMPPKDYYKIIDELRPTYAVIPDVFKNRIQSEKMTREFIDMYDLDIDTQLMFVPQGESAQELIDSYIAITTEYGEFFEILAMPKHIGQYANRIDVVNDLYAQVKIKPRDVHLLGFWDWMEFESPKVGDWNLVSVDTKFPVKMAFMPEKFTSQLDYYNTTKTLDINFFQMEVDLMYLQLNELGWIND